MALQLNLGLRVPIPIVKLDIDLDDRRTIVILEEKHLDISNDGLEVRLRYDKVDFICRQLKSIGAATLLDILYINDQKKLEKFPDQLFVTKLT